LQKKCLWDICLFFFFFSGFFSLTEAKKLTWNGFPLFVFVVVVAAVVVVV
jgi:hypothetical protein